MLGNALVDMYAKCGAVSKARQVLNGMPSRDVVNGQTIGNVNGNDKDLLWKEYFRDNRNSKPSRSRSGGGFTGDPSHGSKSRNRCFSGLT